MNVISRVVGDARPTASVSSTWHRFISWKTLAPIHYQHRWCRDALILSTLESTMQALAPLPSGSAVCSNVRCAFLVLSADSWSCHVVLDDGQPCDLQGIGFPVVKMTRSWLLTHPRRSFAREIWSQRDYPISPALRLDLLETLHAHAAGVRLADLIRGTGTSKDDAVKAIYALTARGDLQIDLASGLTNESIVKSRAGRSAASAVFRKTGTTDSGAPSLISHKFSFDQLLETRDHSKS